MKTLFLFATLALARLASAHGVQTQLTFDPAANKIVARSLIYTSANHLAQPVPIQTITAPRRAYIEPLLYAPIAAGIGYYARPDFFNDENGIPDHPAGPGPAWQYDSQLAGTGWAYDNSTALPNLKGTHFGYQLLDSLKQWNGSTFVDPGAEQVQLILSDGTTSFTPTGINSVATDDSVNGSVSLPAINSVSANPHSSIALRLLGDGATLAGGDDGVYVVKLAITTSATIGSTPVGASDPIYFILTKNASYADGLAAATALGIAPALVQGQVPEPTTAATCAVLVLFARRRRRTAIMQRNAATKDLARGHSSGLPTWRPRSFVAALLWMTAWGRPSVALAHDGPRVWVADEAGTIVTRASDDDFEPSVYSPSQLFIGELPNYFGVRTTQFPGYEVPRDGSGDVPDNTMIGFKIAGPLLVTNARGDRLVPTFERYGSTAPQLSITLPGVSGAQYTRATATGIVDGFDFLNASVGEHGHLAYTLRGDGVSSAAAAPDDTYVLPLVLTSPSLKHSNWFFLALAKDATPTQTQLAASLAQPLIDARPGDANFDGVVNFDDLVILAQNYNQPAGRWWATGDFNFDGATNFDDLVRLAQSYNTSASPSATFAADWALAQSLVPEPAGLAIAIAFFATASRRKPRVRGNV